ncbi:hypothetical protein [Acidovorax radicis]|jgi:hypothetical protein|uniref:hypothetical protein n=1 Tax=Acidovorax radicis TaxID=758826 RepID=UPI001CFB5046|nr:hypothetical protein [Acidovorax radicis]UCV00949.1 hypothetical protein KI609_09535 [Acidovorax radicis]
MHRLRSSSLLARLILAWFALTLASATASPIFHPQVMEFVCSDGSFTKLLVINSDGEAVELVKRTLDCPLCLGAIAPLPETSSALKTPPPMAHFLQLFFVAHIAALAGAPLPARGPPVLV